MISALGEGIMTIADGPEMPSINDFLPDPFVFQGTPFAINRIILVRIPVSYTHLTLPTKA